MSESKTPLVILLSGNGSNLQAIIDAIALNKLDATIQCVLSNNADAFGLIRAKTHHIETRTVLAMPDESRESYDRRLSNVIDAYSAKYVILAGFMRILTASFVQKYQGQLINIHPSLLPKYPGLKTHEKVLANGEQQHGCTVHYVTEEVDGGPIIAQSTLTVNAGESVESLKKRVHRLEHSLYPRVIQQLCRQDLAKLC